jgi:hypothetical protein
MPDDDAVAEGQRLAPPFLDQYAFRAELDKAIAVEREKMMAEMTEQFAALAASMQKTDAPAPATSVDGSGSISALATQLAELTGQGQGRIYVAPDIIERRRKAFLDMEALITGLHRQATEARKAGRDYLKFVPAYRLTNKVQLNLGRELGEALIDPIYRERGTNLQRDRKIYWQGIPNFAMQPINELAEQVHALFSQWTGNVMAANSQPDALMALTAQGAVVHGPAAAVLLRGQNKRTGGIGFGEEMPSRPDAPEEDTDFGMVAAIKDTTSDVKRVQVLGRNTKPVEVS